MADVFLSYKKEDRARIETLARALQQEGFSVWFDYQIETGEDWFSEILKSLRASACVIGCWTSRAVSPDGTFAKSTNSPLSYILSEHREAGSKLCPVILERGPLPTEFSQLQAISLEHWQGDRSDPEWRRLVARIDALVELSAPAWVKRRLEEQKTALKVETGKREQVETKIGVLENRLIEESRRAAEIEVQTAAPLRAEINSLSRQLAQAQSDAVIGAPLISATTSRLRPKEAPYFYSGARGWMMIAALIVAAAMLAVGLSRWGAPIADRGAFLWLTSVVLTYLVFCAEVRVGDLARVGAYRLFEEFPNGTRAGVFLIGAFLWGSGSLLVGLFGVMVAGFLAWLSLQLGAPKEVVDGIGVEVANNIGIASLIAVASSLAFGRIVVSVGRLSSDWGHRNR